MKRLKIYLAYVAVAALFMTSCSKEEGPDAPPGGEEMGTLSFTALLQDFSSNQIAMNKMAMKQSETPGTDNYGLPECPEESGDGLSVHVQLLDENGDVFVKDGQSEFVVPVIPQEDGTWITDEGANDELELPEGVYSINYFGVYGPNGLIYLAPRENDDYGPAEYQNFVSDALPSEPFAVMNGQKKYVDVEVLCYDDHFVQEYGYLFFDFEEIDILYLCLFGNECDEEGRHMPAVFRFDVWNYSGDGMDPKGSKLFTAQNELLIGEDELGQPYEYAEPVCVQLPDNADEIDMYYGEVWLLHGPGDADDELIRFGAFDENSVEDLYITDPDAPGDSESNYYHFREDCGNNDDSEPCFFKEPVSYANHFDGADPFAFKGWDGTDYTAETNIAVNSLWEEGEFTFTDNPRNVHNNWIDETYHGNMMLFNGDPDVDQAAYFATTLDDVCPGADYFVTFNLRNVLGDVSSGGENDVRLVVRNDGDIIVDGNNDPQVISVDEADGWVKVGLRLKADGNGVLSFRLENDQLERSGNDFAIDDMIISNDPTIVNGADIMVIE